MTGVLLTHKQWQLLASVYYYTIVQRTPPSENEIAAFVGVRGPSAYQMTLRLEKGGHLARTRGQPRTIRVLLSRQQIPDFE